jgi:hypothetical protein
MRNLISQYLTNDFNFNDYNELNDNLLYIDYIKNKYKYNEINIQPDLAYRFQGNFYGLLNKLNVNRDLYLFTLYVNGYNSPNDYDGKKIILKIPKYPNLPKI